MEKVVRQFSLYKPIARALKLAAAQSYESFGEDMTQGEIVNKILGKALKVDLESGEKIDSEMSTEEWYKSDDEVKEEIEAPIIIDQAKVDNIFSEIMRFGNGQTWQWIMGNGLSSEFSSPKEALAYKEIIKQMFLERGLEFLEEEETVEVVNEY